MGVYVLLAAIVILLIALFLFLKKQGPTDGVSADELLRLRTDNNQLLISLAKAQEAVERLSIDARGWRGGRGH